MIDVLKGRLPEGLEIKKVQNKSGSGQMKIWFSFYGVEVLSYLPKSCAPGCAERVCDETVCAVMMGVGFKRNDSDMVKHWKEKLDSTIDAGEVIHCQDCRHWGQDVCDPTGEDESFCTHPDKLGCTAHPDDSCSYGERKM